MLDEAVWSTNRITSTTRASCRHADLSPCLLAIRTQVLFLGQTRPPAQSIPGNSRRVCPALICIPLFQGPNPEQKCFGLSAVGIKDAIV